LRAVIYPDSDDTTSLGDGADESYDRVEYKVNRLDQTVWTRDQNEMVHEYVFDGSADRRTIARPRWAGTSIRRRPRCNRLAASFHSYSYS